FVSANAAVRTAVEQALPQLASQLAESGLSLGQSSVGEHEAQEYAQGNDAQGGSQGEGGADVAGGGQGHAVTANAPIARPSQGLLNTYAGVSDFRSDLGSQVGAPTWLPWHARQTTKKGSISA